MTRVARRAPRVVREAEATDTFALGMLACEGLEDAPSAEHGAEALGRPMDVGRELLASRLTPSHVLLVGELDGYVAGMVHVAPREFVRSQHVGETRMLVHPQARREGVGRALLDAAEHHMETSRTMLKLSCRVAEEDVALARLLTSAGWIIERVERDALALDGHYLDVHVYARHRR